MSKNESTNWVLIVACQALCSTCLTLKVNHILSRSKKFANFDHIVVLTFLRTVVEIEIIWSRPMAGITESLKCLAGMQTYGRIEHNP